MSRVVLGFIIAVFVAAQAQAKVVTKTVQYKDGEVALEGHLAWDDAIEMAEKVGHELKVEIGPELISWS